jgi:predicted Zn-dependent protease
MDEELLSKFQEDFALLIEAGFLAVKQLDEPSAVRLFRAAELLYPNSPAPRLGLGYIAMNKLEVSKAIRIFEAILREEPEHHLAQAFLGICYVLKKDKRKEGEALIKTAMEKSNDPSVKNLGEVSLKWIEKDFKDSKAPFFT